MFPLVVLGLSAILGSGCTYENFYFSEVYTVTAEDLGSSGTVKQWYDATYEQTRVDYNKGSTQLAVLMPSKGHPYGRLKQIIPVTTETHLNMKQCTIYEGTKEHHFLYMKSILPRKTYFENIGHEIIHGENATKFWYPITVTHNDEIITSGNVYFWTTRKILHGKLEYVPLKYDVIIQDYERGTYSYYSTIYSDYDTAPIDNGTFMIDNRLRCGHDNMSDSNRFFDELPNFPFPSKILELNNHLNQYRNEEELKLRQDIVERNRKMIEEHNRGDHSYTMAANHLIDRTDEEILRMCGRLPTTGPRKGQPFPYSDAEIEALSAELPEELDWRMYGAVTSVKNQGRCGSCWAFGAIGAVEGALFLKTNRTRLVTLSEQALIDCSWGFQNEGCSGGYEEGAFEYMMRHGIPNNDRYGGYRGKPDFCHVEKAPIETTIQAYYNITQNEKALKVALLKHGPITVAINVCRDLFFFSGGVFDSPHCQGPLNHAVTLVGYGVLEGKSHWIIKNSWSESWAAGGYLLVAIEGNVCRVQDEANFVTLK